MVAFVFVSYVPAFFVCVFCFLLIYFYDSVSSVSFDGYFLVRCLLSASLLFSERTPGLVWFGSVYLVTRLDSQRIS